MLQKMTSILNQSRDLKDVRFKTFEQLRGSLYSYLFPQFVYLSWIMKDSKELSTHPIHII